MATYKTTTNAVATYGEESPAVLALQKELNAKGAGLVEDSKYGPLTQAAYTKFNNQTSPNRPITNTSTTPDTTRFARTANKNDKDIADLESTLSNAYGTEAPDLAKITEQKRAGSQSLVDSITAEFTKTINEQLGTNAKMNDRVRALNVNAGLGGSDFGTAAAIDQEKKGEKAVQMIEQERDAKIQAVYAGIDERASEEYKTQREDYIKGLENNLAAKKAARDEDRQKATESIKGFASAGIDVTKLKETDPDTFNLLLNEYGGSELDLETAWNANLPENMKTQYDNKTIRGENGNAVILRYGFNPITGKTESHEYDMGIPYEKISGSEAELKEVDGRLWSVTTDKNGKLKAEPLTQKSEDDGDTPSFKFSGTQRTKLIAKNFNDADINGIQNDLQKYGMEKVLERLSDPDKAALKEALAGSDLASQIAELMKQ